MKKDRFLIRFQGANVRNPDTVLTLNNFWILKVDLKSMKSARILFALEFPNFGPKQTVNFLITPYVRWKNQTLASNKKSKFADY